MILINQICTCGDQLETEQNTFEVHAQYTCSSV